MARLPCTPVSAAIARSVVQRHLAHALDEERLSTVELLATELVTNAMRHAGTDCALLLSCPHNDTLRVAVTDTGGGTPAMVRTPPRVVGGHGLMLVDALAAAWGVDADGPPGKTVWFEVQI